MSTHSAFPSNIPFLDLIAPHVELERELVEVFVNSLSSGCFVGGRRVEDFESAFAAFCDVNHAIGVGSGTDALRFALVACGVQAGDVVLTVPNTFIATTEAISQAGALPEFVEVDEFTYNMSPVMLQQFLETQCIQDASGRLISKRSSRPVTAVAPVHLYGQMADMDAILDLADQYGLAVVEDACQAHGSSYFSKRRGGWVRAGSVGRAAAFSFYPGKNLGACGEGGAVTTNDSAVAGKIKMLRDHGQVKKYFHDVEGYNGRLDAIQAGILHVKLAHLERWNSLRQECAARYGLLLAADDSVVVPYEPRWSKSVYHLYVIRIADRDGLMSHLRERGIATALHYPVPLHLQRAYVSLGYRAGDFAVSERIASEIVSLPMYPQLTAAQQGRIASEIGAFSARVGCQGVDRVWDAAAQAQIRG